MNVYEVLYKIGVITKADGQMKKLSTAIPKLFKDIIEYIEGELNKHGNKLTITTSLSLRTKAEYDRGSKTWTVYLNIDERRPDTKCILWDLMHEYGHTKRTAQDKTASFDDKIKHETSVWDDAWEEISNKFVSIKQFVASYDSWKKDCLNDYKKHFKSSATNGTR